MNDSYLEGEIGGRWAAVSSTSNPRVWLRCRSLKEARRLCRCGMPGWVVRRWRRP